MDPPICGCVEVILENSLNKGKETKQKPSQRDNSFSFFIKFASFSKRFVLFWSVLLHSIWLLQLMFPYIGGHAASSSSSTFLS